MIVKDDYIHPTFCYFTLEDGSVVTYDGEAGVFLYQGKEYELVERGRKNLSEFLEGFENIEKLRAYLSRV